MAKATGGGRATHAGTDFQNRCAGWFGVLVLAERDVALPLGLPADVVLESIWSEAAQPVDDLNVITSHGGVLFGQAKHNLSLGTRNDSDLASTLDQFVRQYLAARDRVSGALPQGRGLEPERDRLVILTGPGSSGSVKTDLAGLLSRVRTLKPHRTGASLTVSASNGDERHALKVVRDHLERIWGERSGTAPTEVEVGSVLELLWILVLDVDPEGAQEREAKTTLRQSILKTPDQADVVWKSLIQDHALLARAKAGLSRAGLQAWLTQGGVEIRTVRSYRGDLDRLKAHTTDAVRYQARFAGITIRAGTIKIHRACVGALITESVSGPVVVVGEPGVGKSCTQYEAVQNLQNQGHDVVMLAAESLASQSLGELRNELGLEHDFVEVLNNWPGTSPGFLVIDALDAARSDGVAGTLRILIDRVSRAGNRWRVIASIRKFDLRHSHALRRLFFGDPVAGFSDPEFAQVRHLNVPLLEPTELAQAIAQFDALRSVIELPVESLRELLRVPFNLSLVATLLEDGIKVAEFVPIHTQIELFEQYWDARVRGEGRGGELREGVLRAVTEEMVRRRAMRAPRSVISQDPSMGEPLHEVLSSNVLSEWQAPGATRPDKALLAYSHHLLFDYGVARLLFRGEPADLLRLLEEESDLAIALRPSIVLHFHYLWVVDPTRQTFWSFVEQLQKSSRLPEIAKTIGPSVAAILFSKSEDVLPLVAGLVE